MELTGLLVLFTCQPTKSSNFSRSGVNVRAHLLRKNYSMNFSSIRSTPMSFTVEGKRILRNFNMSFKHYSRKQNSRENFRIYSNINLKSISTSYYCDMTHTRIVSTNFH